MVLVVEDAHWADRSSRDLLAFLIGYQRAMRNVLIVVTFRSDELHRTHPLRPLLAELARIDWVERAELPRLTRGQAEELAAAVLGRRPSRGLADAMYQRAEGNPLFTEELLACAGGCDALPDSLADLLLQAVRRLPEDTQEVLRVASAGSGVTSDALLIQVTGPTRAASRRDPARGSGQRPGDQRGRVRVPARADPGGGARGPAAGRARRRAHPVRPGDRGRPGARPAGRADIEKAHHWYSAHDTTGALAGLAGVGAGVERGRPRRAPDAARPRA